MYMIIVKANASLAASTSSLVCSCAPAQVSNGPEAVDGIVGLRDPDGVSMTDKRVKQPRQLAVLGARAIMPGRWICRWTTKNE